MAVAGRPRGLEPAPTPRWATGPGLGQTTLGYSRPGRSSQRGASLRQYSTVQVQSGRVWASTAKWREQGGRRQYSRPGPHARRGVRSGGATAPRRRLVGGCRRRRCRQSPPPPCCSTPRVMRDTDTPSATMLQHPATQAQRPRAAPGHLTAAATTRERGRLPRAESDCHVSFRGMPRPRTSEETARPSHASRPAASLGPARALRRGANRSMQTGAGAGTARRCLRGSRGMLRTRTGHETRPLGLEEPPSDSSL